MPDGSMQAGAPQEVTAAQENTATLRQAFGKFATGVTVVTALAEGGPVGMTANSFTSVSLDPPLVLWCLAKSSSRFATFAYVERFAIHVLSENQRDLALAFAKRGDAFDQAHVTYGAKGTPLICGALARFECHRHALHDAGDHSIIIGQVDRLTTTDGAPLVFCQSSFGAFDKSL